MAASASPMRTLSVISRQRSADESFGPDHAAAVEGDDRLVHDAQLVALEGPAEGLLDLEPLEGPTPQGIVEDRPTRPPARLCVVHGRVGLLEELVGARPRVAGRGDTDARRHRELAS